MTDDTKKNVCKEGKCEDCSGDECKKKCENGHMCGSGECGSGEHECEDVECADCK